MSTQTETPGGAAAEEPTEKKLSEEELKRIQRRYFEEVAKKFERQRMIELEWVAAIDNCYYGMPEMTIHGTVRLKRPPFIDQDLSVVTPRLIRDHVLIEVLNARMLKEFN